MSRDGTSPYSSSVFDDPFGYHRHGSPASPSQSFTFPFERTSSSPMRSPHSPSFYRSGSFTEDAEASTGYQPAVPLPVLSGEGPKAIPDFLKLADEADERAGGGQEDLRSGIMRTYDDVSAQFERPGGVLLLTDVDGADVLAAEGEVAETDDGAGAIGPEAMVQLSRALAEAWTIERGEEKHGGDDRASEGEGDAQEEVMAIVVEDDGNETEEDVVAMGRRQEGDGDEEGSTDGDDIEENHRMGLERMDARFHPLRHVVWERDIRWGCSDDEDDLLDRRARRVSAERGMNGTGSYVRGPQDENGGEEGEEGEIASEAERRNKLAEQRRRKEEERRQEEERRKRQMAEAAGSQRPPATPAAAGAAAGGGAAAATAANTAAPTEADRERLLSAPFPLNPALRTTDWLSCISWGRDREHNRRQSAADTTPFRHLILDRNDSRIFFEPPDLPRPDLRAMGLAGAGTDTAAKAELLMGRRTLTIPSVDHAECAVRHETSIGDGRRACLSEQEARAFHRPRHQPHGHARWALRAPKEKAQVARAGARGGPGGLSMKPIKTTKDLPVYDGDFMLVEYVEECPLMLSNPGMASKLINFWRLSKEDLRAEEMENAQQQMTASTGGRLQRISRETLALNSKRVDLERTHAGVPEFQQGHTIVLYPEDSSPFLGQIEDRMVQRALFNNMVRAPLFEHDPKPTDFLLIRAPTSKVKDPPTGDDRGETECYAIREIPRIYLCGQMEPQMELRVDGRVLNFLVQIFHPDDFRFREFLIKLFKFVLVSRMNAEAAKSTEHDTRAASVIDLVRLFDNCLYLFPYTKGREDDEHAAHVMRVLQLVGNELSGPLERCWVTKDEINADVLSREIAPEDVCLYESLCAGLRRLVDHGISLVGKVASFAPNRIEPILSRNLQRLLENREARAERAKRSMFLLHGDPRASQAKEVADKLQMLYEEVRQVISVGAFILDEIQLGPWYLTHMYHAIHVEKGWGGMFKLQGLGDPSGIGEGFSYLPRPQREPGRTFKEVLPTLDPQLRAIIGDTPPFKMSVPLMNEIIKHLFGTQRRLVVHRLMQAGYETELEDLLKLTRVPKKQRIQIMLEVDAGEVRPGAGMQEYLRTCNSIWNKQVNALSDKSGEFGDEDMLLDMMDLEGLGTGPVSRPVRGPLGMDGDGGIERVGGRDDHVDAEEAARQIELRGREIAEQRAAEERRRMQNAVVAAQHPAWLRPTKVVKRLIKETDAEGNESYRVEFLFAPEAVERVRRQREQKVEEMKREARRAVKLRQQAEMGASNRVVLPAAGLVLEKPKKEDRLKLSLADLKKKDKEHKRMKEQMRKEKYERDRRTYERKYGEPAAGPRAARANKPHFSFNSVLEKIVSDVMAKHYAKPFKRLKGRSIDMDRISRGVQNFVYQSRQQFLDDIATIVRETVQEHGEEHSQSTFAKATQKHVIEAMARLNEDEMIELEEGIRAMSHGKGAKRKKYKVKGDLGGGPGRKPKAPRAHPPPPSMHPLHGAHPHHPLHPTPPPHPHHPLHPTPPPHPSHMNPHYPPPSFHPQQHYHPPPLPMPPPPPPPQHAPPLPIPLPGQTGGLAVASGGQGGMPLIMMDTDSTEFNAVMQDMVFPGGPVIAPSQYIPAPAPVPYAAAAGGGGGRPSMNDGGDSSSGEEEIIEEAVIV